MHSSLGIDYGTNSVRAVIVDCSNGAELGSAVVDYPSGHQGVLLDRHDHHHHQTKTEQVKENQS